MRFGTKTARIGALCLSLLAISVGLAQAEEEKKLGWGDTAELSYVATAGNSETTTLGFKNTTTRAWESALLEIKLGGIRAENTTTFQTAVAPDPNDPLVFNVVETEVTEKTAENYYLNGRYGRTISERLFWYAGAGWDRNRFAGIESRYVAEAGLGHTWWDRADLKFRTGYAASYTDQEDVIFNPTVDETFGGVRLSWNYLNKFGSITTYENVFVFDYNVSESEDWRYDMTKRMALKVSLQWLYDNLPSLALIPLEDPGGNSLGTVPVPLDELDTIFNISLVVDF